MTQVDMVAAEPKEIGSGRRLDRLRRAAGRPDAWRRGLVLAGLAVLLGLLMLLHGLVPNRIGNLGSLVETLLPWFGLFIPVLLAGALWRRSASAVVALLVPVVVWVGLFGGTLGDRSQPGGDLVLAEHNVGAENADPVGTARALAASGADVLALVELGEQARGTYEQGLAQAYPFHTVQGTVGLWSRLPLSDVQPVDTGQDVGPLGDAKSADEKLPDNRALRATVATKHGPLAVYVAHLGSVRVFPRVGFGTRDRDRGVQALGQALAAERNAKVVLLGDLNGSTDDRAFDGLTSRMDSAQDVAGNGFGFSWPAGFPAVRIDHILVSGVQPRSAWTLPATGSDHLPVAARVGW
ncbi:teicoplanin resistance protein VanJ [Catellatospora methionotrophica]|uniref:Teicoplanin resistance protein VanJ n=2 Tax=Catellatospora methionotrophica TaxID=121620 RepID=A0A8J3LD83_9ACTN|nr:endonuclease/exonuclease/phosphatase family protein [Catellatospora methionotrophica]GIG12445.1 teicoplanin resistance protein VanJ [Catellatospora methionotrophica]